MQPLLSAFPLTPLTNNTVDITAYKGLLARLTNAKVDSIGILGSTGCYPYLDRAEKRTVIQTTIDNANGIPVMVGIGSLNAYDVLKNAEDAQTLGASSIMLAPVSYHKLTEDDVFGLFEMVSHESSIPICVYDNPNTTHFQFSDELYARIATLPNIDSFKIPAIAKDLEKSKERIHAIRAKIPKHIKLGVSADSSATWGIAAGADMWFSATGGLFPTVIQNIIQNIIKGNLEAAIQQSEALEPIWAIIAKYHGSVRCMAAMAEILGLVQTPCLPKPLKEMNSEDKHNLKYIMQQLHLMDT